MSKGHKPKPFLCTQYNPTFFWQTLKCKGILSTMPTGKYSSHCGDTTTGHGSLRGGTLLKVECARNTGMNFRSEWACSPALLFILPAIYSTCILCPNLIICYRNNLVGENIVDSLRSELSMLNTDWYGKGPIPATVRTFASLGPAHLRSIWEWIQH